MEENTSSFIDGNGNIVIKDVSGSTITINHNDTSAISKLLVDMNASLAKLPFEVLKLLQEKSMKSKNKFKVGANLYLTVMASVDVASAKTQVISWGTTITNLTREIRYFNRPYFKVYPKFKIDNGNEHDTFGMVNSDGIKFPFRLEYGQTLDVDFPVNHEAFELYKTINQEDAYIQAFVTTTLGEVYSSRQYPIPKFVATFEQLVKK